MQLNLAISDKGNPLESIEISDLVFGREYNEGLIHQVVTAYMAGARQGTHAQKTRAEVRGGGKKPWKQKGTGRARAGTIRSPLWRKGGKTFAAKTQDYSQKVNRKMYRAAMCSIFSELLRQERLLIADSFTVETYKTKNLITKLDKLNLPEVLLITEEVDEALYLAARNLQRVDIRDVVSMDPVSLIRTKKVVMTVPALRQIEEMLG